MVVVKSLFDQRKRFHQSPMSIQQTRMLQHCPIFSPSAAAVAGPTEKFTHGGQIEQIQYLKYKKKGKRKRKEEQVADNTGTDVR